MLPARATGAQGAHSSVAEMEDAAVRRPIAMRLEKTVELGRRDREPLDTAVDLDLTPSHGRLRAYLQVWIDHLRGRDIHRRRGARHADADGGYPVFDALRVPVHLLRILRLERYG